MCPTNAVAYRDTLDAYHKMAMLLQDQGKLSIDMR